MREYTRQDINHLVRESYKGNTEALESLKEYNAYLAKKSNARLLRLEKSGYDYFAYDLAMSYTKPAYGTNRFKTGGFETPKDIRRQIFQMETFLEKKSSTVKGAKQIERDRLDRFRDNFNILKPNQKLTVRVGHEPIVMSDKQLSEFLKFIGKKPIRKLITDNIKGSGDMIDLLRGKYDFENEEVQQEIVDLVENYYYLKENKLEVENKYYYDNLYADIKGLSYVKGK